MKSTSLILFSAAVLFSAGCKTTEPTEVSPLSWKKQSAYMAGVKDPRTYGFNIYQGPGGNLEYRGGVRLHPEQGATLSMKAEKPLRPVVDLRAKYGFSAPVLFDFTASTSWLEFDLAQDLLAVPVGEGKAQLMKTAGEEIPGCLSMLPRMQFDQLFIENPLVYVRMANGSLGAMAREIVDPEPKGVIGWNLLKIFEQIQLDYSGKQVMFSTAKIPYTPDPSGLIAQLPLVKHAGACAVRGMVDGRSTLILIEPAGGFEVASEDAAAVASVALGPDLVFSGSAVTASPGGLRIGAQLLKNYRVTISPQAGMIFFEQRDAGMEDGE